MMRSDFMRNKQRAETCTRNKKKYWACCTILTRIDTIYLQQFSKFAFQEVAHPVGNHTDKFWKFYSPAYALWSPKTNRQASGYTTDLDTRKILIFNNLYIIHDHFEKKCGQDVLNFPTRKSKGWLFSYG